MKQFLSILAGGALFCCVSCNNDKTADAATTDNSMAQKNLAASHLVNEAFQTGDISKVDSAVASDFVDHTDKGDCNRDSLKAMITMMHTSSKDMKYEIIKELADNDYVMSWMRFSGTGDGTMGMPAGPYNMTAIETIRFKDKAVEHWEFMEPKEMMKMMPPPPVPMKMESKDKMKGK